MKKLKFTLLILIVLLFSSNLFAQKWEIFMEGGIASFNHFVGEIAEGFEQTIASGNFGARVKIKTIADSVFLITGFNVALRGGKNNENIISGNSFSNYETSKTSVNKYLFYFIEFPLITKFEKYYCFWGLTASLRVYSKYSLKETEDVIINDNVVSTYNAQYTKYQWEIGKGYLAPEIGFTIGFDFPISPRISIGGRFYRSMNHVFSKDRTNDYHQRQLLLKTGYKFIGKNKKGN